MVFVAQSYLYHFGGTGLHLFGFARECGQGAQIGQST
jgi:hypothetical protein